MSVSTRLVSFAVALAAAFGLAFFVGSMSDVEVDTDDDHGHERADKDPRGHGEHRTDSHALALDARQVKAGPTEVRFRVVDADGDVVTSYDERHERDLHLIVVAADNLSDYQHVHPELGDNGIWTADLRLAPGAYRLFADTQPEGAEPMVLEADLRATGGKPIRSPLPEPSEVATVGRYAVTLAADGSHVTFSVTRDGEPVTDLEPYLGANGHLVAIRATDLAYVHAHPEDGPAGPEVTFELEFDGRGRHAFYFDFQHDGVVRTAQFTFDSGSHRAGSGGHDGH